MTEDPRRRVRRAATPPERVGEKFELLMALLLRAFQLDKGDLDFGLCRVMNMKAAEIEAFLTTNCFPKRESGLSRLKTEAVDRSNPKRLSSNSMTLTSRNGPRRDR